MPTFQTRVVELYNHLRDLSIAKYGRKDFAAFLGVSVGKVNGWLDGTGRPDFEMLKQVSAHSGISILWLIGASDEIYIIPEEKSGLPEEAKHDYQLLVQFLKFKYRVENSIAQRKDT